MGPALELLSLWRERCPGELEPELLLARLDQLRGHYRAARDRALRAVARLRCPPRLALDVANCLRVFVAHDALDEWAGGFPDRAGIPAEDQARIAVALSSMGLHAHALRWVEESVAKAPGNGICLLNRAMIRSYHADFDGARADLEQAIDGPQESAIAHWLLARLDRQTATANHVGRLRQRIGCCSDPDDSAALQFELFKELDDINDTDGAWDALMEGCRQARMRNRYDHASSERLFAGIAQRFPLARSPSMQDREGPLPVFIVGMHRSGTTLVERILSAHPGVHACGESLRLAGALRLAADHSCGMLVHQHLLDRAAGLDASSIAAAYAGEGRKRMGVASHATDKLPGNFQLIGFIHDALPRSQVIHVRRDPVDLCFANLRELFAESAPYSYSIDDIAHFHRLYADLMRHWQRSFPGFVLDVDYEDLVTRPEQTSRRISGFCGLDWRPEVLDPAAHADAPVNTLSSVQVRQPIHANGVGRWKRYAEKLEPLRRQLGSC